MDAWGCFSNSPYLSIKHSEYFAHYQHLFEPFRNKEVIFAEIGVLGGGSLFMWREFFGPKARIIGIDLNPNATKWRDEGFEIYIGDQSDPNFWDDFVRAVGPVDILLDDGGHTYQGQIITVESMLENVNDGGLLVVEDTHSSYLSGFGPRRYSFIEYVKKKIDDVNTRKDIFGSNMTNERRFYSIEVMESMVAFRVEKARLIVSKPVSNGGISDGAIDYRNNSNSFFAFMMRLSEQFPILTKGPIGYIFRAILDCTRNRKFSARRFFEN